jgi:predicted Fe-Mo cluster-binding NifX family protein
MGDMTLLAVPALGEGGLEAQRSGHFGQCDCFTLVTLSEGAVRDVRVLPNPPHEHGGCLRPVELLSRAGAQAIVVAGIGGRPLAGFNQAGIDVYFDDQLPRVGQVIDAFLAGSVARIDPGSTCGCH